MVNSNQWFGNVCKRLEDICVGVDEEIAVMSANVKQFCSDFVLEMLPSSTSEDTTEDSDLDPDAEFLDPVHSFSVENVAETDLFDSENHEAEIEDDYSSFVETVDTFIPWARDQTHIVVKSIELNVIASEDPQSPLEMSGFFTPEAIDLEVATRDENIDPENWERALTFEFCVDDGNSKSDALSIKNEMTRSCIEPISVLDTSVEFVIEKPDLEESCIAVENVEPALSVSREVRIPSTCKTWFKKPLVPRYGWKGNTSSQNVSKREFGNIVKKESVVEKPFSSSITWEPFDWEFSDWEIVLSDNFSA